MDKIQKIKDISYKLVVACFSLLFFPVLFCVIFLDKIIPYYEGYRLATVLPNLILFIVGLIALMIVGYMICKGRKISGGVQHSAIILNISLLLIFIALYFVNVYISRETVYYTGWDPEVVRGYAYLMKKGIPVNYNVYLVINPNNITISYVLGRLYIFASNFPDRYPYHSYDFFWNQVQCALLSVAGMAACCTVKKISKNVITVYMSTLMYIAVVGLTPWKNIAYTDIFSIAFPIMSICFYVYYRSCKNNVGKIIYLILAFLSNSLGGLMKPTVFISLIAIMIIEVTRIFTEKEHRPWKWLLLETMLLLAIACGNHYAERQMVQELGLIENKDISSTWHHYFYMGLNEDTTGGYDSSAVAMIGEFQAESIKERNKAELERAFARIRERGVIGSIYFDLRKMVMTFNDGTFCWPIEGYYKKEFAPIAKGGKVTDFLRDVFWVNSKYSGRYNTFCQLVWIGVLTCLPGVCLGKREDRETTAFLLINFIGIFLYILLFEARARYLLCFVPVLITQASLGLERYSICVYKWISDRRMKKVWKK